MMRETIENEAPENSTYDFNLLHFDLPKLWVELLHGYHLENLEKNIIK